MDINKISETKQSFEEIYFAPKVTGKTITNCCLNNGANKFFYRIYSYLNTLFLDHKWLNEKTAEKMMAPYDDRLSRIDAIFNEQLMIKDAVVNIKDQKMIAECTRIHHFLSVHLNNIHQKEDRDNFQFILKMSTRGYLEGRLSSLPPKAVENALNLNLNGITLKKILNHLQIPYHSYSDARGREKIDLMAADSAEERKKRDQDVNTLIKFLENKALTVSLMS
ncbi:MAG: hypothetical protein CK425_07640 [Parachlamydia sp.]|nr:MAG: hypothetical protein CK425_07640 [Parachlamydia sp.]